MSITTHSTDLPVDVKTQLQQTLADLASGVRDAEKMKAACRRMDQMREENRRLLGEQNIAVDLIREVHEVRARQQRGAQMGARGSGFPQGSATAERVHRRPA